MNRNIHIVMLTGDWRPYDQVKDCLAAAASQLSRIPNYTVTLSTRRGSSMIPHARNAAVSQFMAAGGTDLIFCDADNGCDPQAIIRMLDWPVDVLGIPCRSKSEPITWPIRFLADTPMAPIDPTTKAPRADGLMPVESVGTGIMRITRNCIERMIEARKDDWYHDATSKAAKSYPLFEYKIDKHEFWGEDVWFCLQWRKLGGEIWIDPHTETFHIGPMEFRGSVAGWLSQATPRMEIKSLVDNGFYETRSEVHSSVVNGFISQPRTPFIDEIATDLVKTAEAQEIAA